jgi:hypothetical protein
MRVGSSGRLDNFHHRPGQRTFSSGHFLEDLAALPEGQPEARPALHFGGEYFAGSIEARSGEEHRSAFESSARACWRADYSIRSAPSCPLVVKALLCLGPLRKGLGRTAPREDWLDQPQYA